MREVVVHVSVRRKLGRRLTICSCEMENGEGVDVVACDEHSSRAMRDGDWHMLRRVEIEPETSKTGRRVLRVVEYGEKMSEPSLSSPSLASKQERAVVFARWIEKEFGSSLGAVLDVAGGKGELSQALLSLCTSATVIDPEARLSSNLTGVAFVNSKFEYPSGDVDSYDAVFALHPDEATEAAVCSAAAAGLPFAVVPCCVFPSLFAYRRQFWHCDPSRRTKTVRTHETFVEYLVERAKALGASDTRTSRLGFQGKNIVVYSKGERARRRPPPPTLGDDCVRTVLGFLDVFDDLISRPRCKSVCRKWNYEANKMLRLHLPLLADAFRQMDCLVVEYPCEENSLVKMQSSNCLERRAATPRDLVDLVRNDVDFSPLRGCLGYKWKKQFFQLLFALQLVTRGPVYVWAQNDASSSPLVPVDKAFSSFTILAVRADLLIRMPMPPLSR